MPRERGTVHPSMIELKLGHPSTEKYKIETNIGELLKVSRTSQC